MRAFSLLIITIFCSHSLFAQVESIQEDIEKGKPEKYQNRRLKSEKTGEKKFGGARKLVQNTVTHYNYFFNANNKIQSVIARARVANKDNYLDILPFYDYSLTNTSAQKTELDSVIIKATAGILLHDLRNSWVDDLYLLIGQAYFLRKDMDSASMAFQFINYNLGPKGKNDEETVGTSNDKSTGVSIANKEKKGWGRKPIRNDALIWQIRTHIEKEEYPEAAGLINTLQNDENFPKRLRPELEEVTAYWFYQQKMYDSAAIHLENSLKAAEDKQGKARMEFLIAQLYEITKHPDKAAEYYAKAAKHTNDPLMDIYANLNSAKMYKGNAGKDLDNNIQQLTHLAHKDKYEPYRDVVYYSAGELALKKPDTTQAIALYKKGISYNTSNTAVKNKAYLQLGNIAFVRKDFRSASMYYDSLQLNDPSIMADAKIVKERKKVLTQLVEVTNTIDREDSLQKIAAMSEADREKFIRALVKKIRKERGMKEEGTGGTTSISNNPNSQPELFPDQNTGEWYFYNSTAKARGYNDFKTRWGKRDNVDNWRRSAVAGNRTLLNMNPDDVSDVSTGKNTKSNPNPVDETTYEGMMSHIPLKPEQMKASNSNLINAYYELGNAYLNLEEYPLATGTYETSVKRFPDSVHEGLLYLNAYYAYHKLGDEAKANYYKNLLLTKYKDSKYSQAVMNPGKLKSDKEVAATKSYEQIYNLFIEGNFDEALKQKQTADSLYGKTYWNPQLLYIQSVYYIKQREDSLAIGTLQNLINLYPRSPLKLKAISLIDVLKRRKSIEQYLTNLKVVRRSDSAQVTPVNAPVNNPAVNKGNDNKVMTNNPPPSNNPTGNNPPPAPAPNVPFAFDANSPQLVVMVLNKVDPVYVTEVKNAFARYNRGKTPYQSVVISNDEIEKDRSMLVFMPFANAADAITYMGFLKSEASAYITWLDASKYSYIIISDANLTLLKNNKNLKGYTELLHSKYPDKF